MSQPGKRKLGVCGQGHGSKSPQNCSKFYGDAPIHSPDGPIIGKVYFPTGQSVLSSDDYDMLNQLVVWCTFERSQGNLLSLKFLGNADRQQYASERKMFSKANLELSRQRAKTVLDYVKSTLDLEGIDLVEQEARGLGESHKHTDPAEDRRVDIVAKITPLPPPATTSADPLVKPVQILWVHCQHALRSGGRGTGRGRINQHDTVVVEKVARVEKDQTVRVGTIPDKQAWNPKSWHKLPGWVISVSRHQIEYRVPTTGDRILQGIDIGGGVMGQGPPEGDGLPTMGPPTDMYYSWEGLRRRRPKLYKDLERYKR
jgi:hypothetical protein